MQVPYDGETQLCWLTKDPVKVPSKSLRRCRTKFRYTVIFDVEEDEVLLPPSYHRSRGTKFFIKKSFSPNLLEMERKQGHCKIRTKLSKEEKDRARQVLHRGHDPDGEVIDNKVHHVRFFYSDAARLVPGKWLNDQCINYYLVLLQNKIISDFNTVHVFSTHMLRKLTNGFTPRVKNSLFCEYGNVSKWTRRLTTPLWQHRLVLYPVHIDDTHWSIVVVYTEVVNKCVEHTVVYYDSFVGEKIKTKSQKWSNKYTKVVHAYMEVNDPKNPYHPK